MLLLLLLFSPTVYIPQENLSSSTKIQCGYILFLVYFDLLDFILRC